MSCRIVGLVKYSIGGLVNVVLEDSKIAEVEVSRIGLCEWRCKIDKTSSRLEGVESDMFRKDRTRDLYTHHKKNRG